MGSNNLANQLSTMASGLFGSVNSGQISAAATVKDSSMQALSSLIYANTPRQFSSVVSSVLGSSFSTSFGDVETQSGFLSNILKQKTFTRYGLTSERWGKANIENLVFIMLIDSVQGNDFWITAPIQKNIAVGCKGFWEPVVDMEDVGVTKKLLRAVQAVTRYSLGSRFMSRRLWMGSSPLSIRLDLRFESIDDTQMEVVAPSIKLKKLVLPSEVMGGNVPFLSPPGPSPFAADGILDEFSKFLSNNNMGWGSSATNAVKERLARGEEITITFGKFLQFRNVVVKDVQVTWDNRMDVFGRPVGSSVSIEFETYEMMTKEALDKCYLGGGYE